MDRRHLRPVGLDPMDEDIGSLLVTRRRVPRPGEAAPPIRVMCARLPACRLLAMTAASSKEPFDSRIALGSYAVIVGLAGVVAIAWGQAWFGNHLAELQWGRAVIIRMAGAVMMAGAVCAAGLASLDSVARTRALSWFIAAHVLVWLMLVVQIAGPVGEFPLARQLSWAMLTVILGLLYVRTVHRESSPRPLSIVSATPSSDEHAAGTPDMRRIREAAAQEERNRLARDLHDAVKQQVFAIQTSAATVEARFETDAAGARDALAQVRQSAREAMVEMEALLEQLRVAPIGNTGLVEAIRKQCEALAFRTGAEVNLEVGDLPHEDAFAPGAHRAIFRVVQEALANVGRHARARRVQVSLETTPLRIEARIQDDGVGLPQDPSTSGMGIRNMRARAGEIDGSVEITRPPAGGTLVTLSIPYETADARAHQRKQALGLTAVFGMAATLTSVNLLRHGFSFGNVFVVFFTLAFVHHLRIWWRTRQPVRVREATAGSGS
jgi:signal transduction histidine kinase